MTTSTSIAVVFTGKGIPLILAQGGSASWRLARHRARLCEYVVCTRNTKAEWSEGSEEHGSAFMIGRVSGVEDAPSEENRDPTKPRFIFRFSEYALISIPKKWTGDRYPVHYTTLEEFGIDPDDLNWQPLPDPEDLPPVGQHIPVDLHADLGDGLSHDIGSVDDDRDRPLTMAQAKRGLALTFGIAPEAIEITIRG